MSVKKGGFFSYSDPTATVLTTALITVPSPFPCHGMLKVSCSKKPGKIHTLLHACLTYCYITSCLLYLPSARCFKLIFLTNFGKINSFKNGEGPRVTANFFRQITQVATHSFFPEKEKNKWQKRQKRVGNGGSSLRGKMQQGQTHRLPAEC